jgi:transporter family protein
MTWLIWSFLSAVFAALTAILAKLGVSKVDPNLATAIRTSVIVFFAWSIALFTKSNSGLSAIAGRSWVFLCVSGLATGFSWLCYFRAPQLGPASRVAPVDKLSVVFVILLPVPILGETITAAKIIGGRMIRKTDCPAQKSNQRLK